MDDPRAALRREPPTDLSTVGEDAALVARIRAEIVRDGPMTFARGMELALYDPDGGYYRGLDARPGRDGDFLTAPELHPIFGSSLALGVADIWDRLGRPVPFTVHEHGAGTGMLAVSLLGTLALERPDLFGILAYVPIEVEPRGIRAIEARLADAGLDASLRTPSSSESRGAGVVIANEVLDALPVHRVRQRIAQLREVAVGIQADGTLVEVEVDPTTPDLARRLADEGVELADGQTAEICLAIEPWLSHAIEPLGRGALILIDYGARVPERYDPIRRGGGTLRAYVRHQVHDDPYRHIGRQDLTAHVDVTAVERVAHGLGLTTIGITSQAEALMGLGIEDRLRTAQADPATTHEAYTLLRSAIMRLLDPAAMGRFAVMVFGRDWPTTVDPAADPLRILSFSLPARRTSRRPSSTRPARIAAD
jgi:SAM-dependent MidA family methyltransferase